MEKLKINYPILVEGKYDKIKLDSIVDALVITSEGFRIFKSDEKRALLRRLAEKTPIIVLADSDSAGMLIRSCVKGIIPADRVINVYTPQIEGKEKRKEKPSKEGYVGVEGVEADILRDLLARFAGDAEAVTASSQITKTDMYTLGLSGSVDAAQNRESVCAILDLPKNMSANALLEALNMLTTYEELEKICEEKRIPEA